MERGHLDDVHPDVVQVRYVGKFTPPRVEGDPTRGTIETEDDGIGAWPWILLGVGLVLLCLCCFVLGMRRIRRRRGQREGSDGIDYSVPNVTFPSNDMEDASDSLYGDNAGSRPLTRSGSGISSEGSLDLPPQRWLDDTAASNEDEFRRQYGFVTDEEENESTLV